jgi:tripartite-type tricarboxylate transporter receptor subunit TctC
MRGHHVLFGVDTMQKFLTSLAHALPMLLLAVGGTALAQPAYPTRAIRFIVPFPPGGSTDPMARLIANKLTDRWSQSVVVDNRPGGNTIIGTDVVAKAAPDGYTMLLASSTFVSGPSLFSRLPYNTLRDFTGVATIAKSRFVLVVGPAMPANNLQEFIALAKSRTGKLSYASSGFGANTHLSAELFNTMLGTKMHHIPYKGSGVLVTDLISGRVDLSFQVPITVMTYITSARLKALAITGDSRAPALPEVPTFKEAGLPGFHTEGWFGIVMPAGTPNAAINKMSGEVAAILALPESRDYLIKQASEPYVLTPGEVNALIKSDVARYARIIKDANIKVEQ